MLESIPILLMKKTHEDMIDFLKNDDDSLMVYSNSQELLAIANMFNITINIFTYQGEDNYWSEVKPDHDFVTPLNYFGGWIPDLALYHSKRFI